MMPTAVSDEARTREAEAPPAPGIPAADAKPPAAPKAAASPSSSDAIASLLATYEKRVAPLEELRSSLTKKYDAADADARDAAKRAATEGAAIVKPAVEAVRGAAQYPQPPMPTLAGEPPQPDQRPKPFLEMRSRKEDLQGVIAGLGLIGQMVAARGAPAAGLAAFTGAMKGWAEGDRERAERDWRSYLKAVDTIRHQNGDALKMWEAGMRLHHGNVAAQTAYLAAATAEAGMLDRSALVAQQGAASLAHSIDTVNRELDRVAVHTGHIMQTLVTSEMKHIELSRQQASLDETIRHHRALEKAATDKTSEAKVNPYDDATIDSMAQSFVISGKMPAFGTRNQAGRAAFWKRVGELTTEAGGAGNVAAQQAATNAARSALASSKRQEAQVMAFAKTFDKALDIATAASDAVPRAQAPAMNDWILYTQGRFRGDPKVAKLLAAAETVAMEYSKVMSGSSQGDAASRQHARDILSASLNKGAFREVAEQLKSETDSRGKSFTEEQAEIVRSIPGAAKAPEGPALPKGAKREGDKIISESGKYEWNGTAWQPRKP